jgi:hypothetical protein
MQMMMMTKMLVENKWYDGDNGDHDSGDDEDDDKK